MHVDECTCMHYIDSSVLMCVCVGLCVCVMNMCGTFRFLPRTELGQMQSELGSREWLGHSIPVLGSMQQESGPSMGYILSYRPS